MNTPTLSRRSFFRRIAGAPQRIRPPWTTDESITEQCTACGACIDACPEKIICKDDHGKPELNFTTGHCTFCGNCAGSCAVDGLFDRLAAQVIAAKAVIGEGCMMLCGIFCQSCRDACDYNAISGGLLPGQAPEIDLDACTACGACATICPASAVVIA